MHLLQRVKQLRAERAALVTESERILAGAAAANRPLSDDDKRRDDEIHAKLEPIKAELSRYERTLEEDRSVKALTEDDHKVIDQFGGDKRAGFRNVGEFARAVFLSLNPNGGRMDERIARIMAAPTGYMQETGGTAGEGIHVPPAFRTEIYEAVKGDGASVFNLVTPEPTNSNAVEFIRDETTPWGSAGIQAYWRKEAGAMTASKLAEKAGLLQLHELYAYALATDELLADAPRLSSRLTRQAGRAINYKASDAIINGNGVGMPLGVLAADCTVSQAKETSQTAATVNATNIAKMWARQIGLGSYYWLCNPDVLPQFIGMTIGQQPVFVPPASGLTQAPGGFLMGRPVIPTEPCATVGTVGDLINFDPNGYYAAVKSGEGIQFAESMHLFFDYNVRAFRWTFRLAGQPAASAALSPAKGSTTRSHFVTLATRA
jgi:HK97 family phage major capsid protein